MNIRTFCMLGWVLSFLLSCQRSSPDPIIPDYTDATRYYQEGEVEVIQQYDDNQIFVVFVADGYTRATLRKDGGIYRSTAIQHIEYLFGQAPFSQFRDHFNVSIIYAASTDSSTAFNYGDQPSSQMDGEKLARYVEAATGIEGFSEQVQVLFAVRRPVNGFGGNKTAYFPADQPDIMLHEVGHSFGNLGDEYQYGQGAPLELLADPGTRGVNSNLDITDDPEQVKWKRYFGLSGYEDVGIFEGGFYSDTGVWRPTQTSVMRETRDDGLSHGFNAVGREAIVREIYRLEGKSLSFEAFLEIDQVNVE
ncbi:M64 family metallopeptidase [Pontibacter sp. G13]|uniref:M64 family metallopeptidase n=1 Tax=Pontibacter sp. G13 TaxID=3074898 RepID=UPI0028891D06|nr:M64 family metallopeptidase [Pontibacter sp. G13]WNJ20705.1 M64 family metallopeptidase [Pontibacter sp. G13]